MGCVVSLYCLVVNGNIGAPANLPRDYRNISNFYALPPSELAKYNWYPFNPATKPTINEQTQKAVETLTFDAQQGKVNQSWQVVSLTQQEQLSYLRSIRPVFAKYLRDYLDKSVAPRDYDNIDTAGDWTDDSDAAWAAESKQAREFRSACYKTSYQIENDVVSGVRPVPTLQQFEDAMPRLGWGYPPPPPAPPNGNGTANGPLP
jgi:hypothetical protein